MSALLKYDAACRALAEAKAIDEVKDLRDKADAMRHYARQAKNRCLEVDATEIRIRAERRLGEMLAEAKSTGVLSAGGRPATIRRQVPKARLRDAGVDKKLSSRAQRLAGVPAPDFERRISDWRSLSLREKGRVVPGLPEDITISPTKLSVRLRLRTPYLIDACDVRALSVGALRRLARLIPKIAQHCATAEDYERVGDCVSDATIERLAGEQ